MSRKSLSHRVDERLRNVWMAVKARGESKPGDVHGVLLGEEPMAFAIWDHVFKGTLKSRADFWARWREKPLLVVIMRTWETAARSELEPWVRLLAEHKNNFPQHCVVFAANADVERKVFAEVGLEAIWSNQNAYVNDRIFEPIAESKPGDQREFDAVYDARFSRFKRHQLACKVERLALIHYTHPALVEVLWEINTRWRLRHARILNRHRFWFLPVRLRQLEVASVYHRARVGLCLSPTEGAMLASIQYLLCGLPVVTTPNRGGRDDFFDEENSITVPPDADAVADGVRTLIARRLDPWAIRKKTLARMSEHQARLVELVEEFQRAHGVSDDRLLSKERSLRMRNGFSDFLG